MRACLLGALLAVVVAVPVQAEPRPVVFLEVAEDDAALARQSEVEQELELALDVVRLERAPAPAPGFGGLPLSQQLAALEPVLVGDVLAALWVDPATADPIRVQMAFAGEGGRTEIRIVEEPAGPGATSVLALGVREVLASAIQPAPVATETITPPPDPPRNRHGAVGADFVLGVGTPLGAGPPVRLGLVIAGEGRSPRWLLAGPLLDWRMGGRPADDLFVTSVGGGARVGWLGGSTVRLGPYSGFTVQAHVTWLRTGSGPLVAADVLLRLPVGLAVRIPLAPGLELAVHAGIELLPRRLQVRRRSTDDLVVDTGPLTGTLSVGLRHLP